MAKYEMIIYWSEEDHMYIAEVPELAGCMADGNSYQDAVNNVEQVIDEWIETAKEVGRSIPISKVKWKINNGGNNRKTW
ncbi:type II toxin-antitoxin system HicB family antitoxin [Crenothrix polyspora]|nr:type II toxin-antitoxin system HicB family antitoxin [Crenothrix polyspora]